jgi:hypothetical protein
MRSTGLFLALSLASVAVPRTLRAQTAAPLAAAAPRQTSFDLGAGTYFPLGLVAEGTLELPERILLRADAGFMPTPYSNTIIDIVNDLGAINAFETDLLKTAIENSFVARVGGGWRPFPKLGFEALAGYTLLTAGGGLSRTDLVDSYLESKGSTDRSPRTAARDVPMHTTLHAFDVSLGWRFRLLEDKLVLRTSLENFQCFASSTSVGLSASNRVEQAAANRINSEIQGYLDPIFRKYVKVPLVGVTLAYRF